MRQAGLFAAGVFTLAMFLAAALAIIERHIGVRGFSEDVMDLLGSFGGLVSVFYGLHLSLTGFLQSFTIVMELLLLFVWFLAATRLLKLAMSDKPGSERKASVRKTSMTNCGALIRQ